MSEEMTYRQALIQAMSDELESDPDVFVLGEDVAAAGGAFKLTEGLFDRFGGERVMDTPISEQAIIGAAIGAAAQGLKPVAEIMFADFSGVCFDQIATQLPKYRYMTAGQIATPVTVRMASGAGTGFAAQHSQSAENWFLNIPGLKLVVPSTPDNAYQLTRAAIQDPDPVLCFEHKALFGAKGEVNTGPPSLRLGEAEIVRSGSDVTVVATQQMRHRATEAAKLLAAERVEIELIDPLTLAPFDYDAVFASVEKTNRLVVVQETPPAGSWGSSLIARVTQDNFELLDAPPLLVSADETPVPYAGPLEEAWMPGVDDILEAVHTTTAF